MVAENRHERISIEMDIGFSNDPIKKFEKIEKDFKLDEKGLSIVGIYFNLNPTPLIPELNSQIILITIENSKWKGNYSDPFKYMYCPFRQEDIQFIQINLKMGFEKFMSKYFRFFNGLICNPAVHLKSVMEWEAEKIIELTEDGENINSDLVNSFERDL